jgi:peptidoglycan/xylan/chitin deacetylase (PgdA/CDA1 family)
VPFTVLKPDLPPAGEGRIILGIDDGPSAAGGLTEAILDVLDARGVTATFFMIGARVAAHPALVRRAVAAGHEVAAHGWDRNWPPVFSRRALRRDLLRTRDAILAASGLRLPSPILYRPPRGVVTPAVYWLARDCTLRLGHLTFYVRDAGAGPEEAERVLRETREQLLRHRGGAVVFHSSRYRNDPGQDDSVDKSWLPASLDRFLVWALAEGFTFSRYPAPEMSPC